MFKVILGSLLLVGSSALAVQDLQTTKDLKSMMNPPHKISVLLDGSSVLLSGAGVKGTYAVTEKIAVGGLLRNMKMTESPESAQLGYTYKHQLNVLGAIVDFFPFSNLDENGFYVSAAATRASVKTETSDSYFGKGSAEDAKTGSQLTLGYKAILRLNEALIATKGFDIVFHAGLGYGNGGRVAWSVLGNYTKIGDGLVLDLYMGAQF